MRVVERYGLRAVHKHGHVPELLFTFGLAFIIEELVQMIWGKMPVDYRVPEALNFSAFTLFDDHLSGVPHVHVADVGGGVHRPAAVADAHPGRASSSVPR